MYHGTRNQDWTAHIGACLTTREESAQAYAGQAGQVLTVEIDWSDLDLEEVDGYDRDTNEARGDRADDLAAIECDVLLYQDEDEFGRRHDCYRLVSAKAVAAVIVVAVTRYDANEREWVAQ